MQFASCPGRFWAQIPEAPAGAVGAEAAVSDGGMEGLLGRPGGAVGPRALLLLSCSRPACSARPDCSRCRAQAADSRVFRLLLSPQNTALDKEGQIFGSKLGADGGRPGPEPAAPEPAAPAPAAPPEPPPHPGPPAPAPGSERAGTWRRHRD